MRIYSGRSPPPRRPKCPKWRPGASRSGTGREPNRRSRVLAACSAPVTQAEAAPRAFWKGDIKWCFGTGPATLLPALIDARKVRFQTLNAPPASRHGDALTGPAVAENGEVKGYPDGDDHDIRLEGEQIGTVAPDSARAIDIESLVAADDGAATLAPLGSVLSKPPYTSGWSSTAGRVSAGSRPAPRATSAPASPSRTRRSTRWPVARLRMCTAIRPEVEAAEWSVAPQAGAPGR